MDPFDKKEIKLRIKLDWRIEKDKNENEELCENYKDQ